MLSHARAGAGTSHFSAAFIYFLEIQAGGE